MREQVPEATLLVAGRPMMDIAALATDQPGVVFLPRYLSDAELAATLRRADVVVLPYRRIDNSGVLAAALAFGAPLVMSDVGGFGELHRSDGVGELVPPGDAVALAAALGRLLGDPAARARLAQRSAAAAAGPLELGCGRRAHRGGLPRAHGVNRRGQTPSYSQARAGGLVPRGGDAAAQVPDERDDRGERHQQVVVQHAQDAHAAAQEHREGHEREPGQLRRQHDGVDGRRGSRARRWSRAARRCSGPLQ